MDNGSSIITSAVSSPSSEAGSVDSYQGTPATKLTEFSPECVRGNLDFSLNSGTDTCLPPAFLLTNISHQAGAASRATKFNTCGIQDPFTTPSNLTATNGKTAAGPKLSPTAATFTPFQLTTKLPNDNNLLSASSKIPNPSLVPEQLTVPLAVTHPASTPVPGSASSRSEPIQKKSHKPGVAVLPAIGRPFVIEPTSLASTGIIAPTTVGSTVLSHSRYIMISHVARVMTQPEINNFFCVNLPLIHISWPLTSAEPQPPHSLSDCGNSFTY